MDLSETICSLIALGVAFLVVVIILNFCGIDLNNSSKQEKVYIVTLENVEVLNEIK